MTSGFKKTVSAVAIAAAAGLMSTSAFAADLGGSCCADLEERVAELEATTARKGNRKVSLTISGHVNEAVLFWDDGIQSGMRVVTNGFSMTRFRMRGSAQINSDWSAGFYMEFGLGRTGMSYDVDQISGARPGGYSPLGIRHQALYIKSKRLGTLWVGHTTDAADGLIDICLGCPITSSSESSLGWGDFVTAVTYAGATVLHSGVSWSQLGIGQEGYYATRTGLIKYISPSIAGFSLSASIADADDGAAELTPGSGREHGYDWDVALRYANEFNGVRVAWGATYNQISVSGKDYSSWAVAGSLRHVPTGLYIHANYREQEVVGCQGGGSFCEDSAWAIQAGLVRKLSPIGATTFWFQYAQHENGLRNLSVSTANGLILTPALPEGQIISFGVNQKIDAAAMELYVTYWNVQGELDAPAPVFDLEDLNVVMAGARIRF